MRGVDKVEACPYDFMSTRDISKGARTTVVEEAKGGGGRAGSWQYTWGAHTWAWNGKAGRGATRGRVSANVAATPYASTPATQPYRRVSTSVHGEETGRNRWFPREVLLLIARILPESVCVAKLEYLKRSSFPSFLVSAAAPCSRSRQRRRPEKSLTMSHDLVQFTHNSTYVLYLCTHVP